MVVVVLSAAGVLVVEVRYLVQVSIDMHLLCRLSY